MSGYKEKYGRVVWVDVLRILATWGVISIHGKSCYEFQTGTTKWMEYHVIGLAFSFCVPVFLMLSGMLSLQHETSVRAAVTKRVPKGYAIYIRPLFSPDIL